MVGHKYYGKTPVELSGRKEWEAHDATKSWHDGGEVRKILDEVAPRLEATVARNVSLGVAEYAGDGEAAIRASDDGELYVGLRIWNDEASLIVEIPLKKILVSGLTEMRERVGVEPSAQAAVAQLKDLGRQLSQIGTPRPAADPQVSAKPRRKAAGRATNGSSSPLQTTAAGPYDFVD